MKDECQICTNSANNHIHRTREMMFGLRHEFDYLECAKCGTIQIIKIPDLSLYYPCSYYSFTQPETNLSNKLRSRLTAKLAADYFNRKGNLIGKYLADKKLWVKHYFPPSLRQFDLQINFNSRILDFGCGAGKLLNTLNYFGFRNLTGADAFIEKDIFYPNGVKIFKRELPDFNQQFDLIMLHHVFEHLPNPKETLSEIFRLLAPQKNAIIRLPIIAFAWRYYGINWVQLDPPRHLFLYTEETFRQMAEDAGFKIEKIVYDSEVFQFYGSELYLKDIPLTDEKGFNGNVKESVFTVEQFERWEKEAVELNEKRDGDQACFYLQKS